jgi:cold shock CspA family protein
MDSKITGTLKTWNEEKGFGFITPVNGGQDIFVHISDFPRRGGPPKLNEALAFDVTLNKDGKKKAINIQRPGESQPHSPKFSQARSSSQSAHKGSGFGKLTAALVLAIVLAAGYKYMALRLSSTPSEPVALAEPTKATTPVSAFQCDGRRHCSQMTSCEEAKYFLRNCPNTEMDGDNDGIPCESQWCTSPFAR